MVSLRLWCAKWTPILLTYKMLDFSFKQFHSGVQEVPIVKNTLALRNTSSQKWKIYFLSVTDIDFEQWFAVSPDNLRYKCLLCPKEFSRKSNAKTHYMRMHSGIQEKPAVCHICGKIFHKGRSNRNEHLRTVHGITQTMMRQMNNANAPYS